MGLFDKKEPSKEKLAGMARGVAVATAAGLKVLIEKYDLPPSEVLKLFGIAYASALAEDVGKDPQEMYGEQMAKFEKMMDA